MRNELVAFHSLASIEIRPGRNRVTFEDNSVFELASSIRERGLLNPLIITGDTLLAGETRRQAVESLAEMGIAITFGGEPVPLGFVPVIQMGDIDSLEQAEIEWAENEYRQGLTWQDRAKAEAQLLNLRTLQGPTSIPSLAAELLKRPEAELHPQEIARIRDRVQIAAYLDDPAVAKAKTVQEARGIIKRREMTEKNLRAVQELKNFTFGETLSLHHTDCIAFLRCYEGPLFDVVISDPPYGIGADTFGDGETNQTGENHQYDDSPENWMELMAAFIPLITKQTNPNSSMFLFCDLSHFAELKVLCSSQGWWVQRTPLVWDKVSCRRLPVPGKSTRRQYELILFAVKGEGTTNMNATDLLSFSLDTNLSHSAQKPVKLFQYLAAMVGAQGKRILDPFGGTGTALEIQDNFVTVLEISEEYFGIGLQRLERLKNAGHT